MPPNHETRRRDPVYLREDELRTLREMIRVYDWKKERELEHRRWWKDTQSVLMVALTAANLGTLIAAWAH